MSDPTSSSTKLSEILAIVNTLGSWAAIGLCIRYADGVAGIIVPSMVGVVTFVYGVARGLSHMDLRATTAGLLARTSDKDIPDSPTPGAN
jgi:hypothetical protein